MARVRDPDGDERRALVSMADFRNRRVLEVGSGDGRLTWCYAGVADEVLGIDTDRGSIDAARASTPPELAARVRFEVARAEELALPPAGFDVALLSWSL